MCQVTKLKSIIYVLSVLRCRAYIKKPASSDVKWDAYTAPFSTNIWRAITFFIVLTSGTIVLIQRLFAATSPYLRNDNRLRFTEILFFVTGAFCNQGSFNFYASIARVFALFLIYYTNFFLIYDLYLSYEKWYQV